MEKAEALKALLMRQDVLRAELAAAQHKAITGHNGSHDFENAQKTLNRLRSVEEKIKTGAF